jgi:hypothetical protein
MRTIDRTTVTVGAPVFRWSPTGNVTLLGINWGGLQIGGVFEGAFSAIDGIKTDMSPYYTWRTY